MTRTERLFVIAGVGAALALGVWNPFSGSPAVAHVQLDTGPKIATVDAYVITEKLMGSEELKRIRDGKALDWESRARTLEKELQDLDQSLAVMSQADPKFNETQRRLVAKQGEYQQVQGQRQQELEALNSKQLIECYLKVVDAIRAVSDEGAYTHVIVTREQGREIKTDTVGATLQELLARPVIKSPANTDLTKAVMAKLKLEP